MNIEDHDLVEALIDEYLDLRDLLKDKHHKFGDTRRNMRKYKKALKKVIEYHGTSI